MEKNQKTQIQENNSSNSSDTKTKADAKQKEPKPNLASEAGGYLDQVNTNIKLQLRHATTKTILMLIITMLKLEAIIKISSLNQESVIRILL